MQRFTKTYSVNRVQFRILKKISEGAYGDIYHGTSVTEPNKFYAVKHMRSSSKDTHENIENEISVLCKVSQHANIVNYYGHLKVAANEFLLVMEYCPTELSKFLSKTNASYPLPLSFIVKSIGQICSALDFMHNLSPKLIHRDIKVENTLISNDGFIKICDFGSCTRKVYAPEDLKTTNDKLFAEEEINRNTTPMYRSPEMCDLYSNFPVDEKSDIWALSCIIYKFLTGIHPFEYGEKLAICNVKYNKNFLSELDEAYRPIANLVDSIFIANTHLRPSAIELIGSITLLAERHNIIIQSAVITAIQRTTASSRDVLDLAKSEGGNSASRHNSPSKEKADIFSKMKKHTESLVNRMKDVGNVVKNTIVAGSSNDVRVNQSGQQTKPRAGICKKITSKILVISSNIPKNTVRDSLENIQSSSRYMLVTFSDIKWLDVNSINIKTTVITYSTDFHPGYERVLEILSKLLEFLQLHSSNALLFLPGENIMKVCFYVCAILMLTRSFTVFEEALRFFISQYSFKRMSLSTPPPLKSMKRYCDYAKMCAEVNDRIPVLVSATINRVKMRIPNVTAISGMNLKPVLEVYNSHVLCFTLREYAIHDNDFIIFEAGNTIVGSTRFVFCFAKQDTLHPIFTFSFHTCFLAKVRTVSISGAEFDPCSYMYLTELQNWSMDLDLFFVPSSVIRRLWNSETSISFRDPSACFKTSNQFVEATSTCENVPSILEEYRNFWSNVASKEDDSAKTEEHELSLDFLSKDVHVKSIFDDLIGFSSHNEDSRVSRSNSGFASSRVGSGTEEANWKLNAAPTSMLNAGSNVCSSFPRARSNLENIFSNKELLRSPSQNGPRGSANEINSLETEFFSETARVKQIPQGDSTRKECFPLMRDAEPAECKTNFDPLLTDSLIDFSSNINAETKSAYVGGASANDGNSSVDLLDFESPATNKSNFFSQYYFKENHGTGDLIKGSIGSVVENSSSNKFAEFDPFAFTGTPESNLSTGKKDVENSSNFGDSYNAAFESGSNDAIIFNVSESFASNSTQFMKTTSRDTMNNDISYLNVPLSFSASKNSLRSKGSDFRDRSDSPSDVKRDSSTNQGSTSSAFGYSKPDAFGDLLSDPFFGAKNQNNYSQEKESLNAMYERRENAVNDDPVRRKVDEWARGKQKDIRKLLSALHLILWDGVTKWSFVGESQLQSAEDVKNYYKKACLILHPDRLIGSPHEKLARNIFNHICEAYKIFEVSGFGK